MAMRWHKATNKLRDHRVLSLTLATRGVLAALEELLAAEPVLTGSVSQMAMWVGGDRKTVRAALDAIQASGYLAITVEEKGKAGTFYTVAHPEQPPSNTQADPTQAPSSTHADPKHAPDKSAKNAALQAASLRRIEESRLEENRSPLTPKGEGDGSEEIEVPFSEPLPAEPDDDELPEVDSRPAWKKDGAFVAFWNAYPGTRRKGAPAAFELWKKYRLNLAALPGVIAALNEDKASHGWIKENGRYIPGPVVWMKQQRWLDDPVEPEPATTETNLVPFEHSRSVPSTKPRNVTDEAIREFLENPYISLMGGG